MEGKLNIGDRLRAGSVEFIVTQPRMPCFKLGIRFGRPDIVKRFQQSGRSGFYLAVVREGDVAAGDPIDRLTEDENHVTVADVRELYSSDGLNRDLLRRASELSALPESWREHFRERLLASGQ